MAITDNVKTKARKMHEVVMSVPNDLMFGPTIEWRKDYRKLAKDVRRGRVDYIGTGQEYVTTKTAGNEEIQQKIADMQKFVSDLIKKKEEIEKKIKPLTDAIKWYLTAKATLVLAAEITQKINGIAAATPPGNPVARAIEWFNSKTKVEGLNEVNQLHKILEGWKKKEEFIFDTYIMSWAQPIIDALNGFRDAQLRRAGRVGKWVLGGASAAKDWGSGQLSSAEMAASDAYFLATTSDEEIAEIDALLAGPDEITDDDTGDEGGGDTETTGSNYP